MNSWVVLVSKGRENTKMQRTGIRRRIAGCSSGGGTACSSSGGTACSSSRGSGTCGAGRRGFGSSRRRRLGANLVFDAIDGA